MASVWEPEAQAFGAQKPSAPAANISRTLNFMKVRAEFKKSQHLQGSTLLTSSQALGHVAEVYLHLHAGARRCAS